MFRIGATTSTTPLAMATTPVESLLALMASIISTVLALAGNVRVMTPSLPRMSSVAPEAPSPGPANRSSAFCADCVTSTVTGTNTCEPNDAASTFTLARWSATMPLVT